MQNDITAVDFEPVFERQSSTKMNMTLEDSIMEIDDQISAIEADKEILEFQCQTYFEKSIYDLTDAEEYPFIVAEISDQIRQQKLMISSINRQQKKSWSKSLISLLI